MNAVSDAFNGVETSLIREIIYPLIALLFAVALVIFLWGVVQFIYEGSSAEGREKGRQHMLWGIVGLAIMLSVFGIMKFVFNTVNVGNGINNQRPNPGLIDNIQSKFGN